MNENKILLRNTLDKLREARQNLDAPRERLTRAIEALEDIIDRDVNEDGESCGR